MLSHHDLSECKIAEFEVHGVVYSDVTVTDPMTLDVEFTDGVNTETWSGIVKYEKASTPIV